MQLKKLCRKGCKLYAAHVVEAAENETPRFEEFHVLQEFGVDVFVTSECIHLYILYCTPDVPIGRIICISLYPDVPIRRVINIINSLMLILCCKSGK